MPNLLEQAIDRDDGDHAAKIIQDVLGIQSDAVVNYCSRSRGRVIVNSEPPSLATGSKPRCVFWSETFVAERRFDGPGWYMEGGFR
jgi:hypothetical protein